LWHIMKIYSAYGVSNFIICLGYKGSLIKEYFVNYYLHQSDLTIEIGGDITYHSTPAEPWRITMIDTGDASMTGGRIKRVRDHLPADRPFFMTYGDGVGDVRIDRLLDMHLSHGKKATVTAVRPLARFGALDMHGSQVAGFKEKPESEGGYINGGFFVLDPSVIDLINGDDTVWEQGPLERLAATGELHAYTHDSFWQPMDTLRDKRHLEELWTSGSAPWKIF
jgi:glucose-1-phosphate cytidylyltransferase